MSKNRRRDYGDFKCMTAGLGPVMGYILPLDKQSLVFEVKWLPELDTKKRLEGDYIWLKMVFKFRELSKETA